MLEALKSLEFFVDTDLFLTDTAKYADIVLPACSSLERGEFKTYPAAGPFSPPPSSRPAAAPNPMWTSCVSWPAIWI